MGQAKAQSTRRETAQADRIPFLQKAAYSIGSLVNQFQAAAIGSLVIVLNLGLGMSPALVGLIGAIPRLIDAFSDPLIGYCSDNTRTKFGRRRPWIFFGAISSGVLFALMFQLYKGHTESFYFWYFLIIQCLFVVSFACYSIPWIALGYEMTPDYHERTRLQGFSNFFSQIAWLIAPWFFKIMNNKTMFTDIVDGARSLSIIVGVFIIVGGLLPAIFNKEMFANLPKVDKGKTNALKEFLTGPAVTRKNVIWIAIITAALSLINFFIHLVTWKMLPQAVLINYAGALFVVLFLAGLLVSVFFKKLSNVRVVKDILNNCATSFQCLPFVKLIAVTFLIFNGFMLASAFTLYVIVYYVYAGDWGKGGTLLGWFGTFSSVCTLCAVSLTTWVSTKLGKRKTFLIAMSIAIFGYFLKWVGYNPNQPYLLLIAAPFLAFHLGALFTMVPSMVADVCDLDELQSGTRREGMFSGIYWWIQKLGTAGASVLSGVLLVWTGFDVKFGADQTTQALFYMRICDVGIPILTTAIAMYIIATFDISEDKAFDIRQQIERRREERRKADQRVEEDRRKEERRK